MTALSLDATVAPSGPVMVVLMVTDAEALD